MLRRMRDFMKYVISRGSDIYWEWPWRCRGWKEKLVIEFIEEVIAQLKEIWTCRIDGCRFGMKGESGNFIKKSWKVITTDQEFYNQFRLKSCLGNHQHEWLEGTATSKSAYYPEQMCRSIARFWRSMLLPARWTKMLWTAPVQGLDPFPSLLFTHNEIENEAILPAGEVHHSGGDLLPVSGVSQDRALQDPEELQPGDHQQDPDYAGVSSADLQSWRAQVAKFHRAAGHPIARNLARMLQDAQIER